MQRLRPKANSFVGTAAYFAAVQNINIGGRIGKSAYQCFVHLVVATVVRSVSSLRTR
jgi:hypothetical protein